MISAIRRVRDRLLGDGERSVAIPVFDGPLKPNNVLETAEVLFEHEDLSDLTASADGTVYAACGNAVLRLDRDGSTEEVASFDAPVQALSTFAGGLAVATDKAIVIHDGVSAGSVLDSVDGKPLVGVNALASDGEGGLLISQGSLVHPIAAWSRDLLSHGATGRVLRYDPSAGTVRVLASHLRYCYGVGIAQGKVIASESWAHQLRTVGDNQHEILLPALPGYPARLSRAKDGGYWLAVFAARTQLVEFILLEDDYRREMMRTVPPHYWIAPAMSSGQDFCEPLQLGSVRQMGVLKPWAPPRSYGLVIRLDAALQPRYSLHSRVGGRHHGVTAVAESTDRLLVLSKGAGRILQLPLSTLHSGAAL